MCSASFMMGLATFFQRLRQLTVLTIFVGLALGVLVRGGHMPHLVWNHLHHQHQ